MSAADQIRALADSGTPGPWWAGSTMGEGFWLWQHALAERVATIQRILAARLSQEREQVRAERDREWRAQIHALEANLQQLVDSPDDEQWWPVKPYMDPANDDEVVEVQVLNVDRLRAVLDGLRALLAQDGPRPAQEGEREVWECGPHANAWNGHDARCRRVVPSGSDHPEDGPR